MVTVIKAGLGAGITIDVPFGSDFPGHGFLAAPDLAHAGARMRDEHAFLADAAELHIDYLWKAKGGASQGKDKLGAILIVSGLMRYFCQSDVILWLAADHCGNLKQDQIRAALFHQLCHLRLDPKTRLPVLRGDDIHAFQSEIEAFGLWLPELEAIQPAFVQADLPLEDTP